MSNKCVLWFHCTVEGLCKRVSGVWGAVLFISNNEWSAIYVNVAPAWKCRSEEREWVQSWTSLHILLKMETLTLYTTQNQFRIHQERMFSRMWMIRSVIVLLVFVSRVQIVTLLFVYHIHSRKLDYGVYDKKKSNWD